jgi:DNA repair exonuclease SbcCD ATPase subunit
MKIITLTAENIKRLRAVQVTPEGNTVVIGGRNAQGKSSLLDSIMYALAGGKANCEKVVRDGEKKGVIEVDLSELKITANYTDKGGRTLKVTDSEGTVLSSPQAILDKLFNVLTFDPEEFTRMESKRQLETVRKMLGIDFTLMNAKRQQSFDKRTEINRDAKKLEAQIAGMKYHLGIGDEVSVADLMGQLQKAMSVKNQINKCVQDIEEKKANIARRTAQIEELQVKIRELQNGNMADDEDIRTLKMQGRELRESEVDPASIQEQLANIETTNRMARENKQRAALVAELKATEAKADELTAEIEKIDSEKQAAIQTAQFPILGLSFDDDGLLFNSIPFSQASSAEQLKISVAMGFALNPKLKILLIRNGSLLDPDALRMVAEMADANDGQIWIERVSTGEEVSVIIEDGAVYEGVK